MKTIKCTDVFSDLKVKEIEEETGSLDCPYVAHGQTEEDVLNDITDHAKEVHPKALDDLLDEIEDEMQEEEEKAEEEDVTAEAAEEETPEDRLREKMTTKIKEEESRDDEE